MPAVMSARRSVNLVKRPCPNTWLRAVAAIRAVHVLVRHISSSGHGICACADPTQPSACRQSRRTPAHPNAIAEPRLVGIAQRVRCRQPVGSHALLIGTSRPRRRRHEPAEHVDLAAEPSARDAGRAIGFFWSTCLIAGRIRRRSRPPAATEAAERHILPPAATPALRAVRKTARRAYFACEMPRVNAATRASAWPCANPRLNIIDTCATTAGAWWAELVACPREIFIHQIGGL